VNIVFRKSLEKKYGDFGRKSAKKSNYLLKCVEWVTNVNNLKVFIVKFCEESTECGQSFLKLRSGKGIFS